MTRTNGWIRQQQQTDQRLMRQHANGGRCEECGPAGGCVALLRAVHRHPTPIGTQVIDVLLGGAVPNR